MVLDQWWQRRHNFQLVWSIGLLAYGISTACEFLGGAFGWNPGLYRTWYLVGAFLVPAYLGAGTLYLLNKTRFGYFVAGAGALGGVFSALATSKYAGSATAGYIALGAAVVAGAAIALTTWRPREMQGHVARAFFGAGGAGGAG